MSGTAFHVNQGHNTMAEPAADAAQNPRFRNPITVGKDDARKS